MSTPFSLDSMKPLTGRVLQEGLNRAIRLDPASREKLQALEGRRIEAHLQSPDIALAIDVREGLLQVGPVDAAREAAVTAEKKIDEIQSLASSGAATANLLAFDEATTRARIIDSLFAINKAVGNTIYIKQLKQRVVAETYGEDNVLHCMIEDTESGLRIKYLGNSFESQLLNLANDDLEDRNQRIVADYRSGVGSIRDLAEKYGLSKTQVGDIVKTACPSAQEEQDEADSLPF